MREFVMATTLKRAEAHGDRAATLQCKTSDKTTSDKTMSDKTMSDKTMSDKTMSDKASAARLTNFASRVKSLLTQEIRFVYASEFAALENDDTPIREAEVLLQQIRMTAVRDQRASESPSGTSSDSGVDDINHSYNWSAPDPLLTFEQEQVLFRALNLLRYRVNRQRSRLSETSTSLKIVEKIEAKLQLVEAIRTQLVNSNLRLVSSIARRFSSSFGDVDEFSSDGCMILLGAIDRFDYSRRFRFSTYATHSIQRHFFRAWKIRQRRKERFPNACSELLGEVSQEVADQPVCDDPQSIVEDLMSRAESVLDDREYRILVDRFGLSGGDEKARTLREIASDLGISKERVRQLQLKALEKLRQFLDPDNFNPDFLQALC